MSLLYLVLVETSANQQFLFVTNKLRENVGASELTYRIGTKYTLEAVEELTGQSLYDANSEMLRKNLMVELKNPPIEQTGTKVEVVLAISGKAILLVREKSDAKKIINHVTKTALKEAPGIDVTGVYVDFDWNERSIHEVIKEAHDKYEKIRCRLPAPQTRFQRLPVVEECSTSGLPAASYITDRHITERSMPRSSVAAKKADATQEGLNRIQRIADAVLRGEKIRLAKSIQELEKLEGSDWLAVVHADGNGLGQVFLNFAEYCEAATPDKNRDYVDALRRFSLALDHCTEQAFCRALMEFNKRWSKRPKRKLGKYLPVVALVLGGDDLTIICDGRLAMQFACDFIRFFEEETAGDHHDGIIKKIMTTAHNSQQVASCAGVAIIKPHFPFHAAYELAEDLLQSAKTVKRKVNHTTSAVDFHILYDASGPDFDRIRKHLLVDNSCTSLVARPIVVSDLSGSEKQWAKIRHLENLQRRLQTMQQRNPDDETRRLLPNSLLHSLREGLFLGHQAADTRLKLIVQRYKREQIDALLEDDQETLFRKVTDSEEKIIRATGFLDALDLVEFWENDNDKTREN